MKIHNTPAEILSTKIQDALDEYYQQSKSSLIKKGLEDKVMRGEIVGQLPFGYERDRYKVINVNAVKAKIVRSIFDLYLSGKSILDIQTIISNEYQVNLHKHYILKILNSRFYIGQARLKGQYYDHKYEKLIPNQLFNAVQEKLKQK
jgi:DNA invertase Pin-like site-specific DNA recombinase